MSQITQERSPKRWMFWNAIGGCRQHLRHAWRETRLVIGYRQHTHRNTGGWWKPNIKVCSGISSSGGEFAFNKAVRSGCTGRTLKWSTIVETTISISSFIPLTLPLKYVHVFALNATQSPVSSEGQVHGIGSMSFSRSTKKWLWCLDSATMIAKSVERRMSTHEFSRWMSWLDKRPFSCSLSSPEMYRTFDLSSWRNRASAVFV